MITPDDGPCGWNML